ncbi:MAG: PSD1 and planctomycete cytochrome C domain-containing protein [Verrucomicrobiales bacterium]|nr:PSD1 and planctomycete cytochrome C domain-containing protein [Verrucomicrobiales bacterium]
MNRLFSILLLIMLLPMASAWADKQIPADQLKFFETKIRPTLAKNCYECHSIGAKKLGAKLLVDSALGMQKGGESGSPVVAGAPSQSLLIHALKWENDLEMPPDEPLPEAVIADFEKWIAMGAPFPKSAQQEPLPEGEEKTYNEEDLWSFQPVKEPALPKVKTGWPQTDIDYFVAGKWAEQNLSPGPDASPRTLIRRLYVDLIGLPATLEEIAAFEAEAEVDFDAALTRAVEKLLQSPHYGERWGRHWLDVARFAESNGNDGLSRNASFPNAWRYRDYVIDALNRDVPYDEFLTEQIAGDLLEAESDLDRDRKLVATGFLAIGSKPAKAMNNNFVMDVVADQIEVITSGVIGLSVACARCHDHKFDPVPMRDYYALAGIFTSTETLWGIAANEKLTAHPTQLHVLKTPPAVPAPPEALKLMEETEKLEMRNYPRPKKEFTYPPGTPLAMGVRDRTKIEDCKLNLKGDAKKLGAPVPRGFLSVYEDEVLSQIKIDATSSGRLELAKWLTSEYHPQTARVMVNRIWLHLFGKALVGTPDDFGVYGEKPTHPELLDYLAYRFSREHNWSIKSMIREIVLSRTYRLDSGINADDPENTWISRHQRRRLDAESLRDAMLSVSGNLNPEPADGSPIRHLELLVNRAPDLHQPSDHRSVYLCYMRNSPPRELVAFDLPDAVKPVGKRDETMLPTQSLFLLNSPFVIAQAERLAAESGGDPAKLWEKILVREATATELASANYLLETIEDKSKAMSALAQALFATNEFRYID